MLPMKALSLFSGAGGDTLGLERAGFKVVAFSEFNKSAIQTHLANFPESTLLQGEKGVTDITKLPTSIFEPYKNTIDIVFAGFPCQGFSHAGKKKANDPRNQMYQHFARVVETVRPRFAIGENVPGLRTMKSGPNEEDPLMLDLILERFRTIGYEFTYKVLEATDFGVPQKRKRILLVGWDTRQVPSFDTESFWASVLAVGAKQSMPKLSSFVTASLEDAYVLKEEEIPEGFQTVALPTPPVAKPTGTPHPFLVLKAGEKLLSCTKRDSPVHSEIMDLTRPSKTIICTYDHQPRLLVGLKNKHGSYIRCLLPYELKQIQGFPSEFKLCGTKKEQIVQIGNAVPPAFVYSVAETLKAFV